MRGMLLAAAGLMVNIAAWEMAASQPARGYFAQSGGGNQSTTLRESGARSQKGPDHFSDLRVARSRDGLSFVDTGKVFALRASAPDLLRLPNGDLLALFDHQIRPTRGSDATVLAVSRSSDEGRSWSPARLLSLRSRHGQLLAARHGDLLRMADGTLRLYFTTVRRERSTAGNGLPAKITEIGTAVTQNGVEYRMDVRTGVLVPGGTDLHATVVRIGDQVHLYVAGLVRGGSAGAAPRGSAATHHFASGDGRRFTRLAPPRAAGVGLVGSIVQTKGGLRAYVSSKGGIRSAVAEDPRAWALEPGERVPKGWDPAVVQLKDRSYLMIYCASPSATDARAAVGKEKPVADRPQGKFASSSASGVGAGSPMVAPLADDELALITGALADGMGDRGAAGVGSDESGFVARPNFRHRIDYVRWWRNNLLEDSADNAYLAYDAFIPGPPPYGPGDERNKVEWPELTNMFTDDEYDGPPAPWNSAQHPKWGASSEAARELLGMFREATRHEGYTYPPDDDALEAITTDPDDGEPLLINLLLPQLSGFRTLIKATLADAWRAGEGKVSPERMLEAWRTCFRNAGHLNRGATLIEELVSTANRALVHENARWALRREVFSAEELETALDVLMTEDPGNPDPLRSIRGEHAFTLDATQYLFWPKEPGGEPTFREDRARKLFDFLDEPLADMAKLTGEDAYEAIDTFDAYYHELGEQMSIGYPNVRTGDVARTHETYIQANALTRALIPNLSRVHTLRTRIEASRRATQLAYATHLFKAQHGRWPDSLDELPSEYGYQMRTDPFTAEDFGYRLTQQGPTIYSLGENALDDGGVHSRRWEDEPTQSGSDDFVFWPPQPRR